MSSLDFKKLAAANALGLEDSVFESKQQMMSVLIDFEDSLAENVIEAILGISQKIYKTESKDDFFSMDLDKQKRVIFGLISDEVAEQIFSFISADAAKAATEDAENDIVQSFTQQPELTEQQKEIKRALKQAVSELHQQHSYPANSDTQ